MSASFKGKKLVFAIVTMLCLAVAVLYTLFSARNARRSKDQSASVLTAQSPSSTPAVSERAPANAAIQDTQPLPAPIRPHNSAAKLQKPDHPEARLIALNMRDSPDLGNVEYAPLDQLGEDRRTSVHLHCERVYFAAGQGICLRRELHTFSAQTLAILTDTAFQPRFTIRTDGIPSRARISPDGRYGAFTVFLTGHSYSDAQLSTATLLLNMKQGTTLANLEEFQVVQDGRITKSPDFNYWGVTFEHDSNFFYATLRTGGINYLVRGDIPSRTVSVIYKGVECPSLSPDGKRIAFKKLIARNNWRLTVLELASLHETPLAETISVDDQPEWLDDRHVLYAIPDGTPWMSIMVVPADGTGHPEIFAKGAMSPAVAR